ncbi:LOW QUALITY PROTEIN: urotensin II-related peptide [Puntigrus tetrazona]|uniref:LOW QUALITY PROTEIN: urotensin II-related peptide n=1 Tax=Puntigrus tetrazona TaxID=1606681 RepID=UPI001C8AD8A6|nr:LOW QUALITY PROTEIN: urotensin II-related peptide [Puntigrus tetrazona]
MVTTAFDEGTPKSLDALALTDSKCCYFLSDPWRNAEEDAAQATRILEKLLKTRPMTTSPDGDGKTVAMKALDETIAATSGPNIRHRTSDTGVNNTLKPLTLLSEGHEEIRDGSPRTDRTTRSPDSQRHAEKNRPLRPSKPIDSNENDTPPAADRSDPVTAREELVKMLGALEELHKLMNRTLSHRITIITRGNSNGLSTGKKNKMTVTDGNLKSTTATTIDGGGISPKASTDQMDPKLNGKAYKKSLPSAKKTNKRVCFWKYCSQN